ncbi:MAG: aspartate/glutamate racemase family protein [Pseudomonadota bacterium]
MRIVLINPNTTQAFTDDMVLLARAEAPTGVKVTGVTARFGASLITTTAQYKEASAAVLALIDELDGADAVIVSAFGDPGRDDLAERLRVPVVGLAGASFETAAEHSSGRFGVVTTMLDLRARIKALAKQHGHAAQLVSVRITPGDPAALMADRAALVGALSHAGIAAIQEDGAEAIIVGGGPLAGIVPALARRLAVPVISPVAAAVAVAVQRVRALAG